MRNLIQEISKSIREKELVLFCGAGISKNSGLPLANELKEQILGKLPINEEGRNEIMNSNLPFEAFIEALQENTDISKILDLFEDGKPNTNHILIARLAKHGYIKTIFTTNFDLLIEKALEKEGLRKNKDFEMYYDEEQFARIDFEDIDDELIRVFKIHGSVEDKESIRATLKAVASKTLSEKRMGLIRHIFSTGRHKKVLILGYSCSDEFDITPQIQSINEDHKEVTFVDHSNKEETDNIKAKIDKNPFKRFPGKRIKCNTDNFIEGIWDSLKEFVGEYNPVDSEAGWEMQVDEWAKGLEDDKGYQLKYLVVGSMFYDISNFKRAIEGYEKSLEIAIAIGYKIGEAGCYTNLGTVYGKLGNFKVAIKYYKKASGIFKELKYKAGVAGCITNLGSAYCSLKHFKRSIKYHKESLGIFKEIGDKGGELACYTNLGTAYDCSGDFKSAVEYHKKSLGIAEEIGAKVEESICCTNLGAAYGSSEDFNRAIELIERSLEIKKTIGDKAGEAGCYTNLGAAYGSLGNFKKETEYYLNAEKIFEDTGQVHHLKDLYYNLSLAYEEIGDNENAEKYKKLAGGG